MVAIEVPDSYGYVVLTAGVLPAVTNFLLSGKVMAARKQYDVKYPNLYAVPGYHKNADEFNRVQRGHQHMLENLSDFRFVSFIGGMMHPVTCAVSGVLYCAGSYLYMMGYSDNKLDVKTARLKKGGPILMLGLMVNLVCAAKYAVSLIK
ncbi:hypothetical protein CTEN210_06828 [Chaetoceros tenuissimus]|uniref:Glutathione transferase n=1 Tax=Chaetoceros tenuissimus TaxID=426638 RepID=A0AAD3CQL1_9STRA|nr:hypothetical protein CTEN210_06828 [Chaetoceros tenuissimus]